MIELSYMLSTKTVCHSLKNIVLTFVLNVTHDEVLFFSEKVTPVIPLLVPIQRSLVPRIVTMIYQVLIVLSFTKGHGGTSTVMFLI